VNFFAEALAFIADGSNWVGQNGIPTRLGEHLWYSVVAVALASLVAVPVGFAIGHTGRARAIAVAVSGGARALPTFGVITLIAGWVGIGLTAPMVSFVILAIPSVLAGAYAGFEAVDRSTVDAARAVGMTEWQIVARVEVPLGLPLLIGGIRSAVLQVVATATLATIVGAGGLGSYILIGLRANDYGTMLAGSILVIALAVVLELVFTGVQRLVVPAGVTAGRPTDSRARVSRRAPGTATPLQEEGTQ
jgi:osmoprotectant transport system permease protein